MGEWRVSFSGQIYSAASADEIRSWVAEGRVPSDAHVYHPSLRDWAPVQDILGSAQGATSGNVSSSVDSGKSKGTPFRRRLSLMGIAAMLVGVALIYPIGLHWFIGFLVALLGAAALLNRTNLGVATIGAFFLAIMTTFPAAIAQQYRIERREKAQALAAKQSHAEDLLRLVRQNVESEDWEAAGDLFKQLKEVDSRHIDESQLDELWAEIEPHWTRAREEKAESKRHAEIKEGIALAEQVVSDQEKCRSARGIAEAWSKLRLVRAGDDEWKLAVSATRRLEQCRRSAEQALSEGILKTRRAQRRAFAQNLRKFSLDNSMDIKTSVSGSKQDHLTLHWVLMGDVTVHKLTEGGSLRSGSLLSRAQEAGFSRVNFTDGYEYNKYYTLNPKDERDVARSVLDKYGIGKRLTLE